MARVFFCGMYARMVTAIAIGMVAAVVVAVVVPVAAYYTIRALALRELSDGVKAMGAAPGDDDDAVREALAIFTRLWRSRFGTDVNFRGLTIKFSAGTHALENATGRAWHRSAITVEVPTPDTPLWETALVHELVHIALWRTVNDPGRQHGLIDGDVWTQEHNELIAAVHRELRGGMDG